MLKKENFFVTVIIPAFNGEKYLGEAIESILMQKLKPAEIIVVDDGSQDNTFKIAEKFSGHIKYFHHDRMGLGYSRNRGIALAKGNFIAHLDHDDIWESYKLQLQYEAFAENESVEIVGGLMGSFFSPEIAQDEIKGVYCPKDPLPSFSASAIVIRKTLYSKVGLYREEMNFTPDFEWFLRVRKNNIIEKMVERVICHRRIHKTNIGRVDKNRNKVRLNLLKEKIAKKRENG